MGQIILEKIALEQVIGSLNRARNRRHPAVDREGAVAKKTVE
jgi:hypothetical protein